MSLVKLDDFRLIELNNLFVSIDLGVMVILENLAVADPKAALYRNPLND